MTMEMDPRPEAPITVAVSRWRMIGSVAVAGVHLVALAVAIALWVSALRAIDLSRMTDLGLISVLPPQAVASIAVLSASAVVLLRSGRPNWLIAGAHLLALVFMLFGVAPILEEVPRTSVTWVHLGFVEYIERTGNAQVQTLPF